MTTQHTHGWAELDNLNRHHYGRGKPAELIKANDEMNIAWSAYESAVDRYYDEHYGDDKYFAKVQLLKAQAERASEIHATVYERYNGNHDDNHLEAEYDLKYECQDVEF